MSSKIPTEKLKDDYPIFDPLTEGRSATFTTADNRAEIHLLEVTKAIKDENLKHFYEHFSKFAKAKGIFKNNANENIKKACQACKNGKNLSLLFFDRIADLTNLEDRIRMDAYKKFYPEKLKSRSSYLEDLQEALESENKKAFCKSLGNLYNFDCENGEPKAESSLHKKFKTQVYAKDLSYRTFIEISEHLKIVNTNLYETALKVFWKNQTDRSHPDPKVFPKESSEPFVSIDSKEKLLDLLNQDLEGGDLIKFTKTLCASKNFILKDYYTKGVGNHKKLSDKGKYLNDRFRCLKEKRYALSEKLFKMFAEAVGIENEFQNKVVDKFWKKVPEPPLEFSETNLSLEEIYKKFEEAVDHENLVRCGMILTPISKKLNCFKNLSSSRGKSSDPHLLQLRNRINELSRQVVNLTKERFEQVAELLKFTPELKNKTIRVFWSDKDRVVLLEGIEKAIQEKKIEDFSKLLFPYARLFFLKEKYTRLYPIKRKIFRYLKLVEEGSVVLEYKPLSHIYRMLDFSEEWLNKVNEAFWFQGALKEPL